VRQREVVAGGGDDQLAAGAGQDLVVVRADAQVARIAPGTHLMRPPVRVGQPLQDLERAVVGGVVRQHDLERFADLAQATERGRLDAVALVVDQKHETDPWPRRHSPG
jgi:hypothetical protein